MDFPTNRQAPQVALQPAPRCTLVIFGATGDMTGRLLMPALYNLARFNSLHPDFRVIGIGHRRLDDEDFRRGLKESIDQVFAARGPQAASSFDPSVWQWLMARTSYLMGDFEDERTYAELIQALAAESGGVIFYFATAPGYFQTIARHLHDAGLLKQAGGRWRRVVIEKPFGRDLPSACELNKQLTRVIHENQIFRIDHFLGKETVQNILVSRFANSVFESSWNRLYIDHVQITAAEAIGVERRSEFYEQTGALRDMVPNHLFQLLAMVAMEPPNSFDADAVRTEKEKLLDAIHIQTPFEALQNSVRGQYQSGLVGGKPMRGYREEEGVAPDSRTETYVALKLGIDNWRWAGVPFYLRTGKALARRQTQIVIAFKDAGHALFRQSAQEKPPANTLVLQIQPDEGLFFHMKAKVPGSKIRIAPVSMDFRYADHFLTGHSSGYETLIYDCMVGDATLFQRAADIELGWEAVLPFQQAWAEGGEIHSYRAGSQGPAAADVLLARDGRQWLSLE
ncbi:glucose-6-phosphate dehydrogenase [Pigmentiphaga sp. NML080357]|uniref:glucose-6-phosphate dehydrogenase n=1 Tax=Pigmentiphaga sp. NML080357 TaxID=2008675 RepID=UPI000B40AE83|nr:glucose-6-phosphate dehydrogenase [Pigmentiphaga sp. NML080357]OVZ57793.1 glucose-6-phosphate dehydrogenase [Pigmentiphaga sp. NML080357]